MIAKFFRRFADFKGKQRLARLLMFRKINLLRDIEVQGKFGCVYKLPNIKEIIGFELYISGVFEEEHILMILKRLPKDGVFIDLGANIGSIVIPICKERPDVSAFAVEASSSMIDYLNHNLALNHISNCSVFHMAVWERSGCELEFEVPAVQFGKGSLSSSGTGAYKEHVSSLSIDDLLLQVGINRIDFIKIDIEGFEYFAFKGGIRVLKSDQAPDILFEYIDTAEGNSSGLAPGDAQALLISFGYRLYALSGRGLMELKKPMFSGFSMILATKK